MTEWQRQRDTELNAWGDCRRETVDIDGKEFMVEGWCTFKDLKTTFNYGV